MERQISTSGKQADTDACLELEANRLLAASVRERGYGGYPFHNAQWENRVAANEQAVIRQAFEADPPTRGETWPPGLVRKLIGRLGARVEERIVMLSLVRDDDAERVHTHAALSPDEVYSRLRRLRRRASLLGMSREDFRVRLSDVQDAFEEQSDLHAYHDELHCPPGAERCARTGECQCRWYLRLADE